MPRPLVHDIHKETSERIFGKGVTQVNVSALSRKSNIATSTLYGWRKEPWNMTLYGFARIAKAKGMSDEELVKVIKGIK